MNDQNLMEKIVSLCKRRGFVFPSSEIYGGFSSTYDYGPLGAQILKNIKDLWWKHFVETREDVLGLDGAIFAIQKPGKHQGTFHLLMIPLLKTRSLT